MVLGDGYYIETMRKGCFMFGIVALYVSDIERCENGQQSPASNPSVNCTKQRGNGWGGGRVFGFL